MFGTTVGIASDYQQGWAPDARLEMLDPTAFAGLLDAACSMS